MLSSATLQTIIWTARIDDAERFYGETLGLALQGRSHGALVYRIGAGELRVSPVPTTAPSAHTVLGFAVSDIDTIAQGLAAKGVAPERHDGFDHDLRGVWRAPDGTQVLWFRDPDGNLLSVVQYA